MTDSSSTTIIIAAVFVAATLLTVAFAIPAMITAVFVMAVLAVCVEFYVRSGNNTQE
jgi:hypothetical protein